MSETGWWTLLVLGALTMFGLARLRFARPERAAADRNREEGCRLLARLKEESSPAKQFSLMRRMDPFAFEEMILSSLAYRGVVVTRNARYTGDGGVDGRARIGPHQALIQAKRYSSAINPAHVAAFSRLCQKQGAKGLFIHTGRTGQMSRATVMRSRDVEIVSGDRLLSLVNGRALVVFDISI